MAGHQVLMIAHMSGQGWEKEKKAIDDVIMS